MEELYSQKGLIKGAVLDLCALVLRLFHEQVLRLGVNAWAWGEGLRAALQNELVLDIPSLHHQLKHAYHHWLAVEDSVRARTASALEAYQPDILWEDHRLVNLCPGCFDSSEHQGNGGVIISVDGNFQHTRFRYRHWEFETLSTSMFVGSGRYLLAAAEAEPTTEEAGSCAHHFKATNGWNKTELSTVTKKALAETGLMGMVCRHGTNLRFLDIYGTGERQPHAVVLLGSLFDELPELKTARLCYYVACVFGPALPRIIPRIIPENAKIVARIGCFHIYGHQMGCHVNFNMLRTAGYALAVGEEVEHTWHQFSHLVKGNRVSSAPRRLQNIDQFALHNAAQYKEKFGENPSRRWVAMNKMADEHKKVLANLLGTSIPARQGRTFITHEYLESQARDQEAY